MQFWGGICVALCKTCNFIATLAGPPNPQLLRGAFRPHGTRWRTVQPGVVWYILHAQRVLFVEFARSILVSWTINSWYSQFVSLFFHNCCQTGPPQAQPTNPQFEPSHHRKKRRTSERLKNQCDLDDGSSERQNIAWLSQPAACAADGFCMVLLILLLFGTVDVLLFCWKRNPATSVGILYHLVSKRQPLMPHFRVHCVQCLEDEIRDN